MRISPIFRKAALAAGALGTVALLVGGASFALFTSTATPQTDTFAAGTVILGSPGQFHCTVGNLEPGDSTTGYPDGLGAQNVSPCAYTVQYSGSLPAWTAVDVSVYNDQAGSDTLACGGGLIPGTCQPLYNPGHPGSLNLLLCGAEVPKGLTGSALTKFEENICIDSGSPTAFGVGNNQTLTYSGAYSYTPPGPVKQPYPYDVCTGSNDPAICAQNGGTGAVLYGWTYDFTLDFLLPIQSGNQYQGSSVTVNLGVHAVQAGNNPLSVNCLGQGVNDPYGSSSRHFYYDQTPGQPPTLFNNIGLVYPTPNQPHNGWNQKPGSSSCPVLTPFYHPFT